MKFKEYIYKEVKLKLGNSISLPNERRIYIKEIFDLNNVIYISYDDNLNSGLIIETVSDFYKKNQEYFYTLSPIIITGENIAEASQCANVLCKI